MRQINEQYKYKQLEIYKESLELRHIKTKTLVVNVLNVVFAVVVAFFLFRLDVESRTIFGVSFMFLMLLLINVGLYALADDLYNNLKLAMYVTTIGEYIIATTLIILFQTPSIFTSLFLAYAITSIYQENKVMLISNFSLFISGFLLALSFDQIFSIPGNTAIQNMFIIIFLLLFVMLLTLSSYILIKRKSFFYNHLAQIKESEVRNMDLLMEIEHIRTKQKLNSESYYKALERFSSELSKKIGIENVFARKIQLLRDLKKTNIGDLLEKYPEYTIEQINEIKNMELAVNTKMRNIGIKASKTKDIEVSRKEIFSESQFKSFKHTTDDTYVKIIAFVVFYVMLKTDKPYLKEMDEDQIKDMLQYSEYFYLIDRDVIDVYLNNNEVFDTVVSDLLKEEWNYEPHR